MGRSLGVEIHYGAILGSPHWGDWEFTERPAWSLLVEDDEEYWDDAVRRILLENQIEGVTLDSGGYEGTIWVLSARRYSEYYGPIRFEPDILHADGEGGLDQAPRHALEALGISLDIGWFAIPNYG